MLARVARAENVDTYGRAAELIWGPIGGIVAEVRILYFFFFFVIGR